MTRYFTFLDGSTPEGRETIRGVQNDGSEFGIGISSTVQMDNLNVLNFVGIGTTNPLQQLQVGTANSLGISTDGKVFVVTSNGDVGIGTTTPTSKLHVVGDTLIEQNLYVSGISTFIGNVDFRGGTNGNIIFGDTSGDNVIFNADVNSNIIPNINNTYDFGSTTQRWRDGYFAGTVNIGFASITNATIGIVTASDYKILSTSSSEDSGLTFQRVFRKNSVSAGQLYKLAEYEDTEGDVAIEIQVSSETSSHSGTSIYRFQGGFSQLTGSYYRLYPFNTGGGHGDGPDTGLDSNAWNLFIYGTAVSGSSYRYGVAIHVPAGRSTKNLVVTITELKRGMTFTDQSSSAVITSFTNSGNIYSHNNLIVGNRIGVGKVPTTAIDVNGTVTATLFSGSFSGSSSATFADGSVTLPSIAFTNDLNTGFWRPGEDILAASTGGIERFRIDALGNISIPGTVTSTSFIGNAINGSTLELLRGNMASNDQFRILIGGSNDAGYAEIATADNGNEPIYVRQYGGVFSSLTRSATLLDESGNTSFPGIVSASNFNLNSIGFSNSYSTNGYQKFPGGFTIQWGRSSSLGQATETQTFAIPFTTSVFSIVATPITNNAPAGDKRDHWAVDSFTLNNFRLVSHFETTTVAYNWIAMGI
jgi:hypothetical protein